MFRRHNGYYMNKGILHIEEESINIKSVTNINVVLDIKISSHN